MPSIGGAQFCEIGFTEVELDPAAAIGAPGAVLPGLRQALLIATVAKCAEMIGGAQRVLDTAVTYARDRVQFGRPIGSFQAIQHHCADMLMDLERARWLTYKAAAAIDRGDPDPVLVAKAKVCCNDSYRHIVRRGHQVMGGIGYCEEHEMPLYFRHARMAETAFGDSDGHLASLATQLLGPA
jgi:alkylation response protein AidB-like acyl-CoA dehydrogenase